MRGPPRRAIHGPTRLTRRPAGLPTDSSLRSASVVDGACQIKVKIKIKSRARRPSSRPEWLKQKQGTAQQQHSNILLSDAQRSKCGSGLAREGGVSVSSCVTDPPPSRASPLPQFDRVQPPPPQCFAFLWELACLRCRHLGLSATHSRCLRRQASSHKLTESRLNHRTALLFCGSWLACDADNSVHQRHPVDAIAGKPAPTI